MKRRKLGPGAPRPTEIGVVGLGCMGMSEFYGAADEAACIDAIHHALDVGVDFLDTADMYGSGHNERLVGRALKGRRDRAVLATKFAILRGEGGAFLGVSGKPEYVKQACDASLARLGVEHIDLYYQHRVDPQVPIEETVGAMAELVRAGKVRRLGLSECSAATLRRAQKVHPIAAVQSEYSLWSRDPEREVLAACAELGVTFVAYSPLGRGFLTGALPPPEELPVNDYRRQMPRAQGDNLAANLKVVERVKALAAERGVTPAQLALAWVLARGEHVVTIPGTRSARRIDENAAAAAITLSPDELRRIDEAFPPGVAAGERYPEAGMGMVNR